MIRLVLLLLGVEYLRKRWRSILLIGLIWLLAGLVIFIDALDNAMYFPINFFAYLFLVEGLATLAVAWTGVGGQRILRYVKGGAVVLAAMLIFAGHHHGNFLLSMIFGTLFLADGLIQCISAYMVRYRRWRVAFSWGLAEIALAIFFYQPYPTHYVGTLPYCLGLFLMFGGANLMGLAARVRRMSGNPALSESAHSAVQPDEHLASAYTQVEWEGPPAEHEQALTVHVWTPAGSARSPTQHYPIVDRYIAAVDVNGVISTGHAALESPEGIYISLYPRTEIDRSPDDFGRLLRATRENDVPGVFQPDYATESKAWCLSTVQVRIRNYDPRQLQAFWRRYRCDTTYNLTHRNCSSTVARALEAAIDGAVGRLYGDRAGWRVFFRILATPELWVAAQIRKRAVTMAWTPGLTLDYSRALSMLADPRPFAWWKLARTAFNRMAQLRREWRAQDHGAVDLREKPDEDAMRDKRA
jgi:uncharacterized membrane protein HdeD (DUF308 family)